MNENFTVQDLLELLEKLIKENPERKNYRIGVETDNVYYFDDPEYFRINDKNKSIIL